MATGNPGNLSDGTSTYFSCKVLSLAVRPAEYIQGDIYLAEKRERCCRCHTLAWVPGGWQSKGSGTRKSRHPCEALGDGTGAAGAADDGAICDDAPDRCALASALALGFADTWSFFRGQGRLIDLPPVAAAVRVWVRCCWVLSPCKPAPSAERSWSPLILAPRLMELEKKSPKPGVIPAVRLSQTPCPRGFLGPNSVDTGTWGEERKSSGFALQIHFIAQNRTH